MTGTPEVLAGGATLGDRFVARLGVPSGPGWSEVPELFGAATLAAAARAWGTTSHAVAATLLFEQYAQRLVAPVLAARYREHALLDARLPRIRARVEDGRLRRLAFALPPSPLPPSPLPPTPQRPAPLPPAPQRPAPLPPAPLPPARLPPAPQRPAPEGGVDAPLPVAGSDDSLDTTLHQLLAGNLDPVADDLHRRTRAGRRVLRGAVANAVASSLLHLSWPHADRSVHLADALRWLDRVPGWAGLVEVRAEHVGGEPWMYLRRATCCLAFRTAANQSRDQPYCSSCPVLPPATTAALFERATTAYAARFPR